MTAINTVVLKQTMTEVMVRVTGTGTSTITLASLALATETYTSAQAQVDIRKVYLTSAPTVETTVVRNSVPVLDLYGNLDWNFEDAKISDQGASDIVVTTTADVTLILTLRKSSGYAPTNPFSYLTDGVPSGGTSTSSTPSNYGTSTGLYQ
jgi:hypothetical protein